MEGRYDDAARLIDETMVAAQHSGDRQNIATVGAVMFPMLREQGRSAELEAPTRRIAEAQPQVSVWRAGLAQSLADQGKLDEAAEHVEYLAPDQFAHVQDDVLRWYTLVALAEVVARLGDTALATALAGRLESGRERSAIIGTAAYHGAIVRYLGLLAGTVGDHDRAVIDHEAALANHERMRARPWTARSQYDLAGALLARGAAGDRDRALGLLNEALDTATAIGQKRLVEEVLTAKLELQGIASGSMPMASIDAVAAGISIERPDLRRHAASDGTVTVLFSDIEGYTVLNERLGDARSQELLRAHDALVRDAVTAHGGTVVKSAGDGYMVVFPDAGEALACAIAVQRAHDARDFGADAGPIRVRIGLHTGEVIREGDDFFGRTVILAARIAASAKGGEILVSDALRSQRVDYGTEREAELKGISTPQTVHPVRW
jgi:class 3 adenylate cyclase